MVEKLFNQTSVILSVICGGIASYLGGWDVLLKTIVMLAILDYATGILKAVYQKQLSSEIGFKGIIKKVMMFLVICASYSLQSVISKQVPLREITIMFFIINEGISLLENASELIPVPDKIKEVLLQLRDKEDK